MTPLRQNRLKALCLRSISALKTVLNSEEKINKIMVILSSPDNERRRSTWSKKID